MEFQPYEYQKVCIQQVMEKPACALWLDMGLGKTMISLMAINELRYNRFEIGKVLVIAPKKVAEATWQDEAARWDNTKHLRFSTVLGSQSKRIQALCASADIYVINRDNVKWLVEYYRNDWPFDMVVIDEASSFKSNKAQRWKALKSIRPHIKRMVELTGTPAPHSLLDLWPQIYLLDQGERLGKTISGFRDRYFNPDKRNATQIFSWEAKSGAEDTIKSLLSDICISMKSEDYLQLPPVIEDYRPVVLSSNAQKAYDRMENDALLQVDDQTIDAGSAAVLTNKLLQLCNGAVYDEVKCVVPVHDCKIEAFLELVEGLQGQHALVFYSYQHDRTRLLKALEKSARTVKVYTGAEDERAWNAGQIDILLAHPASCAYGLNLQRGGHHVIWFGLTWSLELYQQANKRLHRNGQTQPVIVHHLITKNGMDEDVLASLQEKADTQEALLQALKVRIRKAKEGRAS